MWLFQAVRGVTMALIVQLPQALRETCCAWYGAKLAVQSLALMAFMGANSNSTNLGYGVYSSGTLGVAGVSATAGTPLSFYMIGANNTGITASIEAPVVHWALQPNPNMGNRRALNN